MRRSCRRFYLPLLCFVILKEFVVTETIQDLLILQDRNSLVSRLKLEIKRLPAEVAKLEAKIREEEQSVETARSEIQELEVRRKKIELDVASEEEQITRYKTQQLQVKKNDEYQALTHQIEQTEEKIGELETAELEIMESIDEKNESLRELKADVAKRVDYQKGLIAECNEKLAGLNSQLEEAEANYAGQVAKMSPKDVSVFEILVQQINREPYIVEVQDQKCSGCHMRVSNDILKKAKMGEVARCDQCSRIVYFNS